MSEPQDETRPLLASSAPTESNPNLASRVLPSSPPSGVETQQAKQLQRRWISSTVVVFVLFILLAAFLLFGGHDWESKWLLRGDPYKAANRVLERWPVIDGHIDLPILYREFYANDIYKVDLKEPTRGDLDIPRLRTGHVGGFWWSTWVPCPDGNVTDGGSELNFDKPSWRVRDTLEQISLAHSVINQYPDTFRLVTTSHEAKIAMREGKVASFIGIEGAHQLGNSLGVLRAYHRLGVRYMTLTHTCHNAFADSGGFLEPLAPLHYGLSQFGTTLIREMNRLGIVIDLSHTSDQTAVQALNLSRAPVIWSHSSSREVWNVARNVPASIASLLGTTKDKKDGVIMVNFAPFFVAADGEATVEKVADHVEFLASVAGKAHVGIGSDFDGIPSSPVGLEDVSKYPNLIAALIKRGWSVKDLRGLSGGNFLRVLEGVESVKKEMEWEGVKEEEEWWDGRADFPKKNKEEL